MSKPLFIYLGRLYPPKMLSTIVHDTRGKVGFSNHNFEQKLIDGLCQHTRDINLHIVSAPDCYSYPMHNHHPWIRAEHWEPTVGVLARSVGFCNIVGINKWTIPFNIYQELHRIVEDCEKEQLVYIIVNTPATNLLHAVNRLKKTYPNKIRVALIVPDIPAIVSIMYAHNPLERWILGILDKQNAALYSVVDTFVLLTEQMKELIPVGNKPYIIMEGLCNNAKKELPSLSILGSHVISILYTGTLLRLFGIVDLLEAFSMLPMDNVELWLCGRGDAVHEIQKRAAVDPRIKYFGFLSPEKTDQLQQQADILVNPRTNDGEYTKYSFPSKTMEYLLAGKPVVMHRLDGIPKEYDSFLLYPENNSVAALSKMLSNVVGLSNREREKIGQRGRQYVLKQKNAKLQTERIINLIMNNS